MRESTNKTPWVAALVSGDNRDVLGKRKHGLNSISKW